MSGTSEGFTHQPIITRWSYFRRKSSLSPASSHSAVSVSGPGKRDALLHSLSYRRNNESDVCVCVALARPQGRPTPLTCYSTTFVRSDNSH